MATTLLLVDDHPRLRKELHLLLDTAQDLRVVGEASDGQTAIELVRERSPEVVVMDITISELDGIEVTRHLLAESPQAKVVALSIHAEKYFVEDMLRAGAAGYILKESVPEELVNGIRTVAGGEVYLSAAITDVVVSRYLSLLTGEQTLSDNGEPEEPPQFTADLAAASGVITTKLHRPPLTPDLVPRPRLLERLNRYRRRPLTLISGGAGYGKSTLVNHWLETSDCPSAWLSLDERDDNLVSFLTYFLAAIRTIFPKAGQEALALVQAPSLPPPPVLVTSLANELDQIEDPFILVLEDYHHIGELAIQDLLTGLLHHPPRSMHLVIVTRRDPLLDLTSLRARGQVTEIGDLALRFTVAETATFLQVVTGAQVDEATAAALAQKVEGWVTALRLSALSLRQRGDLDRLVRSLPQNIHYVTDYLMTEVVSHQPPAAHDFLLKTAILDRFCAPLADAIMGWGAEGQRSRGAEEQGRWGAEEQRSRGAEEQGRKGESEFSPAPLPPSPLAPQPPLPLAPSPPRPPMSSQTILEQLQRDNLFIIPLDDQRLWFRYHHLFQDLLQQRLNQTLVPEAIAELHRRASEWFESQGLITESFEHALSVEDMVRAAEIVERYRHAKHEVGRWHVVESWLARLPARVKQERPALLLTQAWIAYARFQMERIPSLVEQAESLLDDQTAEPLLLAELNFFRGNLLYWQAEAEAGVRYLEAALAQVAMKDVHVMSNIELVLGLTRHMNGQKELAIRALTDRIQAVDPSQGYFLAYLIADLAFIHLLSGELTQTRLQAQRMQPVTSQIEDVNSPAWSWYLQACTHLHTYDLDRAAPHFAEAAQQRYILDTRAVLDALAGLALAQQLRQQPDEAGETMDQLLAFARETNDPYNMSVAQSCQARLALLRGDLTAAARWARSVKETPAPAALFLWLEVPCLTQARVLIALESKEDLDQATELLRAIRHTSDACHFTNHTIEAAVLQSLALDRQGRPDEALAALAEVVALAEPGGWIRPFVELGQPMADLLTRLKHQGVSPDYVDEILAAFGTKDERRRTAPPLSPTVLDPSSSLIEPLTRRELEILELLAQRLSDKEIGQRLVIATMTVKKHNASIYQKLGVKGRHEAVSRAITLGILPEGEPAA